MYKIVMVRDSNMHKSFWIVFMGQYTINCNIQCNREYTELENHQSMLIYANQQKGRDEYKKQSNMHIDHKKYFEIIWHKYM